MKKLTYIIFLGFTSLLFSQNKISGIVTDQNNQILFGVQIYIEQLHLGTTSDENGSFSLDKIPNGEHQIIFSFIGFQTEKRKIKFLGATNEINIKMTESVFHMDEVIVSSPFHKIQSENVMKVEYKSMESLQKNGEATLIQGITSIPGVEQF
jgi:iron complex outermembrane receptor protein